MPDIPPIRIVAAGSVSWPPVEEMRKKLLETRDTAKVTAMTDQEVQETYKMICANKE